LGEETEDCGQLTMRLIRAGGKGEGPLGFSRKNIIPWESDGGGC